MSVLLLADCSLLIYNILFPGLKKQVLMHMKFKRKLYMRLTTRLFFLGTINHFKCSSLSTLSKKLEHQLNWGSDNPIYDTKDISHFTKHHFKPIKFFMVLVNSYGKIMHYLKKKIFMSQMGYLSFFRLF